MADVRFSVLGRVAVSIDNLDVPIRGRRERAVLALLLAGRRQVVSVDRLIEEIWGETSSDSTRSSLQVAISRLRILVEPDREPRAAPQLLVSSGAGYALLTPPGSVDSEHLTTLVDTAHKALAAGAPLVALTSCDQIGELWAGNPFADAVDSDMARSEQARLADLWVYSRELRAEALLALGRHALVTGDLEGLVGAHPFRERLWELYALALYRGGRQADALSALRQAREMLVGELGVDPSPALRQLESDLLSQADSLNLPKPISVAPHEIPATQGNDRPDTSRRPVSRPDSGLRQLVGRDNAVRLIEDTMRRVIADRTGQVVVISGEAGIGKTRQVTALAETAAALGAQVLWGRCHEADVTPAYWPWIPIIRQIAGARPPEEVAVLLAPPAGFQERDAGSAALRTFDAVSRLIAAAGQESPIVLVLEDTHWADTASLQLLAYAAEALRDAPVFIVATLRTVDEPTAALQACLAALGRLSALRVPLRGLTAGQVRELVCQLSGSPIDDELAAVMAERTDGNPFFVIELFRLLHAEQNLHAMGARQVGVPHGVLDVLKLRLARLPDPVRKLLSVGAVAGRDFPLDLVASVSNTDPSVALDLLDQAVASYTVEEEDHTGRYRFVHALVRQTLYESLSQARRGQLHAAVAVAMEPRLAADPDLVAEVAHHFVLGTAWHSPLALPAVRHAVAAAGLAEARGAFDQALVHWEQALTADRQAPDDDLRRRFDVLLGLGKARHRRGDVAGSRVALDAAVNAARELDDIALMALAATSFRGAGVWHWREFGTNDPAMVAVLRACIAVLPPGVLHARALASLAMELTYEWRSQEADMIGAQAVAMARALGDQDLFAHVVGMRTLALWGKPGAAAERIALTQEVLAHPLNQECELYIRFGAAAAHLQAGDAARADEQMMRCLELARRLRHTGADVPIAWWLACRAIDRGDQQNARQLAARALEQHERSSLVSVPEMAPLNMLRLNGARDVIAEEYAALTRDHPNPAYRAHVAHFFAEAGMAELGASMLGPPVPEGAWDYASTFGDCMRVEVLAEAAMIDELPAALARIQPWGHEFAIYGSVDCAGSIDYFIGRGLEALGDLSGAKAAYQRAAAANRDAGIVPWHQRAEARLRHLS